MNKVELLKAKIAEICNDKERSRNIYVINYFDDEYLFIIEDDHIFMFPNHFDNSFFYFIPDFTQEDAKEAQKIERELNLDRELYLPILNGTAFDLQSLIDYYEDEFEDEYEDKIEEIQTLIEVLSKENCAFYNREDEFLNLFLYPDLKSGIAYVHSESDYYESVSNIGLETPLYETIANEPEFFYPEDLELSQSDEEIEEICDYWLDVLSNLDDYIMLDNQ